MKFLICSSCDLEWEVKQRKVGEQDGEMETCPECGGNNVKEVKVDKNICGGYRGRNTCGF